MRQARRRQRVAEIHWVDALYQVYITGLLVVVAVVLASGLVGDEEAGAAGVAEVIEHGPAVVGIVMAVAVMAGLRSGSRGGPLALEAPDVRHVLLSPVPRSVALRGPALRQLRFALFAAAGIGAAAGQLAMRRLPGSGVEWIALGAALAITIAALAYGCALVASGLSLPRWVATGSGGALVLWAALDMWGGLDQLPDGPTTHLGSLGIWPLEFDPLGLIGPVLGLVLLAAGLAMVSGISIEAAERRTALVGQLHFAVTLQDLRTVLVLRRQLAQEVPRSRPWIGALGRRARFPVLQRGVRSLARWPVTRILRVALMAAVAGVAMRAVWAGTTPMVVVAGLALWVAALDAAEPLGQEVDHPGRTDAYPHPRGQVFLLHLPIVLVVSIATGLLAALVALVPGEGALPADIALLVGAASGLLAGCGAAVSITAGAPQSIDALSMTSPEIAGIRSVFKLIWPPAVAVAGTVPVLAARAAAQGAGDPPAVEAALLTTIPLVLLTVLVAGWVRFRDDILRAIAEAMEQASPSKAMERMAAEREEAEAREAEALKDSRRQAGLGELEEADDEDLGDHDDEDESDAGPDRNRSRPPGRPRPKPKPRPASPAPGSQGGRSPKPIGRRRDQKR